MNRLLCIVGGATLLLGSTGCLGTHSGRPDERGTRSVKTHERIDRADPVRWAQVYLEQGPKAPHLGYVRSEQVEGGKTQWVYDLNFHLIGKVTPFGHTFTIRMGGHEVDQGHFNVPRGILKIFGYTEYHPIELRPMSPPRSS